MQPVREEFRDLPPETIAGLERDAQRLTNEVSANEDANTNPLPGPLLEAFAGVPEEIAGLKVRPLVHYDFVILKQLGSPLLEQMKPGAKSGTQFTDQQGYEMIYLFTRPIRQVAEDLRNGREAFARQATEMIGMEIGPLEIALLVKAVERGFMRYFSTAIKYAPPSAKAKPEDPDVFIPPPAGPTTGSAGGSTTSAP